MERERRGERKRVLDSIKAVRKVLGGPSDAIECMLRVFEGLLSYERNCVGKNNVLYFIKYQPVHCFRHVSIGSILNCFTVYSQILASVRVSVVSILKLYRLIIKNSS